MVDGQRTGDESMCEFFFWGRGGGEEIPSHAGDEIFFLRPSLSSIGTNLSLKYLH